MLISKVIYRGTLRCEAVHLKSAQHITTDAPPDNRGKGEAFSPTDLLSTSLATCMLTVMAIAAGDNEKMLQNSYAEVVKVMAAHPRRVSEIHVTLYLPEGFKKEERTRLERVALNCPVAKSLHPDIVQKVEFKWILPD
ncbi:OsmC family protein [Schleiferia thermophila]|uniref:Putative OsmC-like protein n=1 Tax=Schleiferia thermophila TaxID=884107 RepID=A0A369ADR6_9FLAO|nr:OsmC family protein [Schleiferia thermophila]RCX05574.1 putative OsmC-like protein [Schleiferia thermophila]GCD78931.1 stress-induced protein OsmC [Schleiferia thermophila]